jgi:hypothetical protein
MTSLMEGMSGCVMAIAAVVKAQVISNMRFSGLSWTALIVSSINTHEAFPSESSTLACCLNPCDSPIEWGSTALV